MYTTRKDTDIYAPVLTNPSKLSYHSNESTKAVREGSDFSREFKGYASRGGGKTEKERGKRDEKTYQAAKSRREEKENGRKEE